MNSRRWRGLRWATAGLLVLTGAVLVLLSEITGRPQSCSEISAFAELPDVVQDMADQRGGELTLPLKVCGSINVVAVIPLGVAALLLLLPDFSEIGFGGLALKRLEERIVNEVERATSELHSVVAQAVGIEKDVEAGVIRKGSLRNVELRVQTVQEILLRSLLASAEGRDRALYDAGYHWGLGWSRDFVNILSGVDVTTPEGVRSVLSDWSYYDSTAGMGRIEFQYDERGLPDGVRVHNSFLGIERDGADLRILFGGYIAGSLAGLLSPRGAHFDVELAEKSVDRDTYTVICSLSHA